MEEDIKILEDFIKYFEAEAVSRKYRRNISITVGEDDIEAIENLIKGYRELEEKYEKLSKIAIETTFDGSNNNTEFLARTLLKQGKILFNNESKMYLNPHTDEEFEVYGMMFEKEKCYLLDDDKLDDYTQQLEYQIKNSIPISKIKEILDRLHISDIEPWTTYKVSGQILFDLQELMEDK